ncbi:MAG: TPM domain-containing protein, partial [Alteraurantiacibacter sp.]
FTAMSLFVAFPDFALGTIDALSGGWSGELRPAEIVAWAVGLGLVTFLAFWALLGWDPLRFAIVPSPIKRQRVNERAIRHFKVGAEGRTHGKTGVLLYLSMREHRAEIIADDSITALVPAEVWGEAMADMLVEIRKGAVAEGIAAGVRDVGQVLSEHFPRGHDDENELPDRLIEV